MNKIIIILVIFVMLFSGFTLLENSQTNNFYENNINTNNFISSNSPIYNLTIYIHNSPAGNGYYQQLFNFNSTSYFINNLNQNASNFYISYENGTLIYSWIQNWNFTTKNLTIWSKLQNGTKVIMIEIFNQNTNLLSANGHIGEAPQLSAKYGTYFNAPLVFGKNNATDFNNLNGFTSSGTYSLSNGIVIPSGSNFIYSNSSFRASYFLFDYYLSGTQNSSTSHYAYVGTTSQQKNDINQTIVGEFGNNLTYPQFQTRNTSSNLNTLSFPTTFNQFDNTTVILTIPDLTGGEQSGGINGTTLTSTKYNGLYSSGMYIQFFNGGASTNTLTLHIEYAIQSNYIVMPTYSIELNIYNINIKSFDKQSNSIHNYFFYNNSVYSSLNNTFIFKNKTSFSTISLIPLNFSSYFTEYKNITISQSQFLNNNNSYYYNLSIYYFNSNLNAVNPYDFTNYIYPISILVFLVLGGIILFGRIKYRGSN